MTSPFMLAKNQKKVFLASPSSMHSYLAPKSSVNALNILVFSRLRLESQIYNYKLTLDLSKQCLDITIVSNYKDLSRLFWWGQQNAAKYIGNMGTCAF